MITIFYNYTVDDFVANKIICDVIIFTWKKIMHTKTELVMAYQQLGLN